MYKVGVIFMGLMRHHLGFCVYIPINVISLYTVDFTEFDPMLPITTLWFSDYHPSLKTDNVVNNVFSIHILTSFISHRTKSNLTKVRPLFTLSHRGSDNSPLQIVFK